MGELLDLIISSMEHALELGLEKGGSESLARSSEGSLASRIAQTLSLQQLSKLAERFLNPQVAQTFLFAVVVAVLLVGISFAVHLAIERRHGRIFISFQHERESAADTLASEMASSGIAPVKLPFVENPDHDILLDQVKQAIRDCDVFVCLPGKKPSFVESEVLMAFGLEKPLLFLLAEMDTPRLPNTAKKGYPIFALERVQSERFRTLANFCSYLAADWRSTARMYGAIFGLSLYAIGFCVILAYLVSVLAMLRIIGPSALPKVIDAHGSLLLWTKAVIHDPPSLCLALACLVFLLVPYGGLIISRLRLRTRIRRAIAAERFTESLLRGRFLPKALDYSLAGANLLKQLYHSEVLAEHESAAGKPGMADLAYDKAPFDIDHVPRPMFKR